MDKFSIGGKVLESRFLLGTGKFASKVIMRDAIEASGAQIVTVAMRRIDLKQNEESIVSFIPQDVIFLTNTSGARTAEEAIRIARMAKAAGQGNWVKIEVINDSKYLLPDNIQTIKATEVLAAEGFIVLPYMNPDLYVARELVKVGAAAVMPLGSLIGSNQGLKMRTMIEVLRQEITTVPLIVDAGIGAPSQAAEAMEIGADAVLVNTAVAVSRDPVRMAKAFAAAVQAGRDAYCAGLGRSLAQAEASSPLVGLLHD